VELRRLRLEDEPEARAAHAELAAEGFAFLPFFEPDEPWAEYLGRVERLSRGVGLAPQFVPWTDLYGVVDGVVVGRVSVRHRLTEGLLQVGGPHRLRRAEGVPPTGVRDRGASRRS